MAGEKEETAGAALMKSTLEKSRDDSPWEASGREKACVCSHVLSAPHVAPCLEEQSQRQTEQPRLIKDPTGLLSHRKVETDCRCQAGPWAIKSGSAL